MYKTKADLVYYEIKKDILQKHLAPGERLIVSELSKKYDVSPIPVREALIRLAQESFVEMNPHVGAKVSSFNEEKMREINQLRMELEPLASKLLAPVITDEQLSTLDDLVEEGRSLMKNPEDISAYFQWNRRFHFTIAEMNPNHMLEEYIKSTWQHLDLINARLRVKSWRSEKSFAEHALWVESLRTRDPEEAARMCRKHCISVVETDLGTFLPG